MLGRHAFGVSRRMTPVLCSQPMTVRNLYDPPKTPLKQDEKKRSTIHHSTWQQNRRDRMAKEFNAAPTQGGQLVTLLREIQDLDKRLAVLENQQLPTNTVILNVHSSL